MTAPVLPVLVVALAGCSSPDPGAPSPAPAAPAFEPPPIQRLDRDPGPAPDTSPDSRTLVFFVADTVRADRLSACGHHRPTSPVLEGLVAEGAQLRCDGISPGSWTVPAHASFLSGRAVWEHGAHRYDSVQGDCATVYEEAPVGTLTASTWLHTLQDQGWRTVCLTENKAVSDAFGLTGGCGTWVQLHKRADLLDPAHSLAALAGEALAAEDPRPLALFVNVMDAHRRLAEIPEGHPFLPAQPHPALDESWDELRDEPEGPLRARYDDLYDHGVWRADQKLGQVLALARQHRPDGLRLVVTSDHGEMLGEGGFVSHGNGVWDPLIRVPIAAVGFDTQLPEGPLSTALLHDLVLDQPLDGPGPVAVSTANPFWSERFGGGWASQVEAVRYEVGRRVTCRDAGCVEEAPPFAVDGPTATVEDAPLAALQSGLPRALDCAAIQDHDAQQALLRELGYIE